MAGQQTLNLFIVVRIHVSEPSSTRSGRPEQGLVHQNLQAFGLGGFTFMICDYTIAKVYDVVTYSRDGKCIDLMGITRNTLRAAVWMALITSAGYVVALPILFGLMLIDANDTSVGRSAETGAIFVLVLPAFFLLQWLRKKTYFRERLTLTPDQQKLFFTAGWGVAGILFLIFIFNLQWFDTHDSASTISGLIVLWALMFGALSSIVTAKQTKNN